jgi:hypothetical protein
MRNADGKVYASTLKEARVVIVPYSQGVSKFFEDILMNYFEEIWN